MPEFLRGDIFETVTRDGYDLAIVFGHLGFNEMAEKWRRFCETSLAVAPIGDPFLDGARDPPQFIAGCWFWFVPDGPDHGMDDEQVKSEIECAVGWVEAKLEKPVTIITNGIAETGSDADDDGRARFLSEFARGIEARGHRVSLISLSDVFVRLLATRFRAWMDELCTPDGDRPEWPLLVRRMLHEELERARESDCEYAGAQILIPRGEHEFDQAGGENLAVCGLYRRCLADASGLLTIDGQHYWLLSYQVPNQHHYRGRRADLLALTPQGGLREFECKIASSGTAPIAAMLEGLDYLACLLSPLNFTRLANELAQLRGAALPVPDCFADVAPQAGAQHGVVVLSPGAYFGKFTRSRRGLGWQELAAAGRRLSECVELGFAVAEIDSEGFYSRDIHWA